MELDVNLNNKLERVYSIKELIALLASLQEDEYRNLTLLIGGSFKVGTYCMFDLVVSNFSVSQKLGSMVVCYNFRDRIGTTTYRYEWKKQS